MIFWGVATFLGLEGGGWGDGDDDGSDYDSDYDSDDNSTVAHMHRHFS